MSGKAMLNFLILCTVLLAWTAHAQPEDGKYVEIHVITYNLCGLPDMITSERGVHPAKKRFPWIAKQLRDYDIIALQEVFVTERSELEKKLAGHFLARGTDAADMRAPGSGLYTFSRGSIPRSYFEMWEQMAGYDALSHKGLVAATVRLTDELSVDVYNLHAQAHKENMELRIKNYDQLVRGMDFFSGDGKRPILVMGDFNCKPGRSDCEYLMRESGLTRADDNEDVDHIFYDDNGSGWRISVKSWSKVFEEPVNGARLSDHEAVEAVLSFEKP